MGDIELTDERLTVEMLAHFGVRRSTSLIGWCVLFMVAGADNADEMRHVRIGGKSARYEAVRDLVRFAELLRAKGYDLDQEHVQPDSILGVVAVLHPA